METHLAKKLYNAKKWVFNVPVIYWTQSWNWKLKYLESVSRLIKDKRGLQGKAIRPYFTSRNFYFTAPRWLWIFFQKFWICLNRLKIFFISSETILETRKKSLKKFFFWTSENKFFIQNSSELRLLNFLTSLIIEILVF